MSPFVFPIHSFYDINGRPLVGGRLYSYETNSDTPQATYTNPEGTELNENPIVLNSRGECRLYIDESKLYRFVLEDSYGNTIWSIDKISTASGGSGSGEPVVVEGTTDQIKVTSSVIGGVKHFVVGLSNAVTAFLASVQYSIGQLTNALSNKKDKQNPLAHVGSTIQTVTRIAQDANGRLDVDIEDIAFPDWTSAINTAFLLCEQKENKKDTLTGYESSTTYYPSIKAVVDFVNAAMQNLGGKLITDGGDPFTDSSDLPSTTPYGGVDIADKDYAYVQGVGTAERWSATVTGSSVAWVQEYAISIPVFTPQQQAAIDSGITAAKIDTFLTKTGDGSDVTATFTAAGSRTNISTGDKLSVIFGKVAKWFSDLKAVAFTGNYSDLSGTPTIPTVPTAYTSAPNMDGTASAGSSGSWARGDHRHPSDTSKQDALPYADSKYGIDISGTADYANNVLPYYVSTNNDKSWLEVGTYKANNSDEMYTGITFAVKFRSVDGHTQCGFMWVSVGEWKSGGGYSNSDIVCEYYTLGRRVKEPSDSVKLYVNILGTAVTDGVKIYAFLSGYSNISLTPLNVNKGTFTPSMTYLDSEPATKKEVTYCNLLRSTYGTAIGNTATPIYIDGYGIPQTCSTIGFADSAKQISDNRGTEGQDGYKAIYGGYNNGTSEFGLGISKRENGETKYTEINADGVTTNGIITAGIGFVGNLNGVANKAVSDGDGNPINTTYAKKIYGIYNLDQYLAQGASFHDVNLRKQLGNRYTSSRGFTSLMMFYGIINFVDIEYADGYDYAAVDFELYNTLQSGTYGTLMASIGMVVPKGTSSIVIPLPFAWNSGSFSPTLYGNFAQRITAGSAVCNAYYYSLPV